jgi:hypothetical protein
MIRNKYSGLILPLVCILLLFIAGCVSSEQYPSYLSHGTTYTLAIRSGAPLSNATFYLPLPVKNDTPMVGSRELFPEDFQKAGYSVAFTRSLPDNNFSGEFPVRGSQAWYLRISASQWPEGTYKTEITNNSFDLTSTDEFLRTRLPLGNESVFLPKYNFSVPYPERIPRLIRYYPHIEYTSVNIPQTIPVYAEYSAEPGTKVEIYSTLKGNNQWLEGPDQWYTNSYWDEFSIGLEGPYEGWYPLSIRNGDGWFEEARGTYPDLTDPEWQRFS